MGAHFGKFGKGEGVSLPMLPPPKKKMATLLSRIPFSANLNLKVLTKRVHELVHDGAHVGVVGDGEHLFPALPPQV